MAKKAKAKRPAGKSRTPNPKSRKHVYFFGGGKADGNRNMKDLLGGKGSGLAEMTNAGLPVPPGFTISTEVCNIYYKEKGKIPAPINREIVEHVKKLEKTAGATLGSTENPLLVSVRSGAKFSMPGMMDTILNLGLNDDAVEGLKRRTDNGRFAFDSYRRFIQMFGNVVLEIPKDVVRTRVRGRQEGARRQAGHRPRRGGAARGGRALQEGRQDEGGPRFPAGSASPARDGARRRVPVVDERARHRVPPHLRHPRSHRHRGQRADDGVRQYRRPVGTGVGFTRNPATGAKEFYGEFLINAQGEDVVAGIRTPQPIRELEQVMPKAYKQLREITTRLEKHYKDVQDFEFTIQDEKLFMLQTRSGKRTGYAAVVIATDLVAEKLITPKEADPARRSGVAQSAAGARLRS